MFAVSYVLPLVTACKNQCSVPNPQAAVEPFGVPIVGALLVPPEQQYQHNTGANVLAGVQVAGLVVAGGGALAVAFNQPVAMGGAIWRYGFAGAGAVAIVGAGAFQVLTPTTHDGRYDGNDAVAPVLYIAGVAAIVVGLAANPLGEPAPAST